MRIGHGYDVHRFAAHQSEQKGQSEQQGQSKQQEQSKHKLILGGVAIDYHRRLEAHSDGDVVLHAVTDAILGAAALGDIGRHFPDDDPQYKGVDSRMLMRQVVEQIHALGYGIGNLDVTIAAQKPKLAPHIDAMCHCLAQDLQISLGQVNVKATTTEKLGFVGREEGIACDAVVLLHKGS